jgi:hypothetical protein
MSDDSNDTGGGIAVPPIVLIAMRYAARDMHIFPARCNPKAEGDKAPPPGYMWLERASTSKNHVIEDFLDACQLWGEDNVSVAWALGLDGYMAIDLDVKPAPSWWDDLEPYGAINITARGKHLFFQFPDEFEPGNGNSRFPTKAWGEVRGRGGYVVIAGPDRPGFDPDQLDHAIQFPYPEWLSPYGGGGLPEATDTQVKDFANHFNTDHELAEYRNKINGIEAIIDSWEPGEGRHPLAQRALVLAADEAALGYYSFPKAWDMIRQWWIEVIEPHRQRDEFLDMTRWAVGQALAKIPTPDPTVETDEDESPAQDELITGVDESFRAFDLTSVLAGNYVAPMPEILQRDDKQALFYLGMINGLHGPSGEGKSFLALAAVVDQLQRGHTVMLLDMEDTVGSIVSRLRQMGADDEMIRERLVYVRPTAEYSRANIQALVDVVLDRKVRLIVLDSLGEAFGLDGVNEDKDAEVGPWLRKVVRKLADLGPCVIIIDHSTKAGDNPLYPSGSKRKRAAIGGASYLVEAIVPLDRMNGGRLRLTCAKDRHGSYRRNEKVADFVMTIDVYGCQWRLWTPSERPGRSDDPALAMAMRAVETVRKLDEAPSQNRLILAMGKGEGTPAKRAGIDLAVDKGWLIESVGARNARIYSLPTTESDNG